MSNQRIDNRTFSRMSIGQIRELYRRRGWPWMRNSKLRRLANRRKYRKNISPLMLLRNYVSYPYKTKTKSLGKGRMVTTITQILVGTMNPQVVQNLFAVAFSSEFMSMRKVFLYYKILGVGLTFMPQNMQTNSELYFMVNWDGYPVDEFRLNDSVNIVSPFNTRPKTFFFKTPQVESSGKLLRVFRQTEDLVFDPTLQLFSKDNTVDWRIRVDIIMEFRTLRIQDDTKKIIFTEKEKEKKFFEDLIKEREEMKEIRKKLNEERKKRIKEIKNFLKEIKNFNEIEDIKRNEIKEKIKEYEEIKEKLKQFKKNNENFSERKENKFKEQEVNNLTSTFPEKKKNNVKKSNIYSEEELVIKELERFSEKTQSKIISDIEEE